MFTDAEIAYLLAQSLGRMATMHRLQVSPVCYTFDPAVWRSSSMTSPQPIRGVCGA